MICKIQSSSLKGHGPIKILFPGTVLKNGDTGIASIGRIDHSSFEGGTLIPMHPHVNDEIITYMKSGDLEHLDSEGYSRKLNNRTLMLMKSDKLFHHEEKIVDNGESYEALQIFIRPGVKDLEPEVKFMELDNQNSIGKWRTIAHPKEEHAFQFSSTTWIYDIRMQEGEIQTLPIQIKENFAAVLYVFNGKVTINNNIELSKQDSIVVENDVVNILSDTLTDLVLFVTGKNEPYYDGGMFSGNRNK